MAATETSSVRAITASARAAARTLARSDAATRDAALHAMADALELRTPELLEANASDLERGEQAAIGAALLDRLRLTPDRIAAIARDVRTIAALPDPVGETISGHRLENGLEVRKVSVPIGVVAVIYEARPNVTIDCSALCLKSGNAIVLRGSSAATESNRRPRRARSGLRGRRRAARRLRIRSSQAATGTSCASSPATARTST